MTNEEARRILMSDADFSGIGEKAKVTADALCVAIDALQKQMPMKPIIKYDCSEMYICPKCFCAVEYEVSIGGHGIGTWRDRRCGECGQSIDWKGVEW